MTQLPILANFAVTTINPADVKAYLKSHPAYFEAGWSMGSSEYALRLLNYMDFFEFHFRRYLAGYPKTLHRVFYEIRVFTEFNAHAAPRMIGFSLDAVQDTILKNEWYELMPRYTTGRKRIESRFAIEPYGDLARLLQK